MFSLNPEGSPNTMSEQDNGASTQTATGNTGANAGEGQKTDTPKTFTEADIAREADRRVTAAQQKWKADQDAIIADKTKDAESKLAELTTKAEEAERYATFIEVATTAGIRNVKAAYKVAKGEDAYFDKRGNFDPVKFRADNPEFFNAPPNANAGAGAGAATNTGGMNAFIRAAAGRG